MLELLADESRAQHRRHAPRIAKLRQASVGIEVWQDGSGDTVTCIDVVAATIDGGNGVGLLVSCEVVGLVIVDNRVLEVHIVGRDPGEVVEAPIQQITHICPEVIAVDDNTNQVAVIAYA